MVLVFRCITALFSFATLTVAVATPTSPASDTLVESLSLESRIANLFIHRTLGAVTIRHPASIADETSAINGLVISTDEVHSSLPLAWLMATGSEASVKEYGYSFGKKLLNEGINTWVGGELQPPLDSFSSEAFAAAHLNYSVALVEGLSAAGVAVVVPISAIDRKFEGDWQAAQRWKMLCHHVQRLSQAGVKAIWVKHELEFSSADQCEKPLRQVLPANVSLWSSLPDTSTASAVKVICAGADAVISPNAPERCIKRVVKAVNDGAITLADISAKCLRMVDFRLGARKIETPILAPQDSLQLLLDERRLVRQSLVLLRNNNDIIPLRKLDERTIAAVHIGPEPIHDFDWLMHRYAPAEIIEVAHAEIRQSAAALEAKLSQSNTLIVIAEAENDLPRSRHGMSKSTAAALTRLARLSPLILVWNGPAKALLNVSFEPGFEAIVLGHANAPHQNDFAIQGIFGGMPFTGTLRQKVGQAFDKEIGIKTTKTRLGHALPEEVGIDSKNLMAIDKLMADAIAAKATPGAQVWFSHRGMVVMNRCYGYHTYDSDRIVERSTLYDLASITKIAASTASLMKLQSDGLFQLDLSLCDYLGEMVDTTEYANMSLRSILAHQAGLPAFVPFASKTTNKGTPRFEFYSTVPNETYPWPVARDMYLRYDYPAKMMKQILQQKIGEPKYLYSDVGYYFMQKIIEKQSQMPLNQYVEKSFYKPLGLSTMCYKPLGRFSSLGIAPTEFEKQFRNQLIHGHVHDPGAAMMGGVAGHAGLFSNANDLGTLMQMLAMGGEYGGERYVDSAVINEYVRCQFCDNNRRGAGFDKPLRNGASGPSCGCTHPEAFGHQGFTGTVTWADPENEIVYVFLSNRVYPDAENKKLSEMNVRTEVQQIFYDAVEKGFSPAAP